MEKYILSLDLGTTSVRAILFDKNACIKHQYSKQVKLFYPNDGYVLQDANEIYLNTLSCISNIMIESEISFEQIDSIGITNQRETTIIWDKITGLPIYSAIGWQSRQSRYICDELINDGYESLIRDKTGLPVDAYFSATKIKWILDNVENAREKALNNELMFGTVDTWILYKLTGNKAHLSDYSNASRTMLYNINELKWDEELLEIFNIPKSLLPEVLPSSYLYGYTDPTIFFNQEIKITSLIGDQQASLFGQKCFNAGNTKTTYGTGAFMLMNTSSTLVKSSHGLISTIAWGLDNEISYALEGSIFMAGSIVSWLIEDLQIINNPKDSEECVLKANKDSKVIVVPAFVGLGSPHWNNDVYASILGMNRNSGKNEIVKAALESIAYQVNDVLNAMFIDSHIPFINMKVDGKASENNYLMQFQSDLIDLEIERSEIVETTALGAAFLAGLNTGFWTKEDLNNLNNSKEKFNSQINNQKRIDLYQRWAKALGATISFK